jgi:hypothetical protein
MGGARYLLVAVALALTACGGDDKPDIQEIEGQLDRIVQEQTGTQDLTVSCADEVSEGDVCDVTAPGGLQAEIRVTRLDGESVEGELVRP